MQTVTCTQHQIDVEIIYKKIRYEVTGRIEFSDFWTTPRWSWDDYSPRITVKGEESPVIDEEIVDVLERTALKLWEESL